jgi:xanthine dehydrogenase accessory factor
MTMAVWPTIERFLAEHGRAALVTLAEVRGSSPREAGARMVVRPDGGFSGTIGGGALEWIALADAQSLLAAPAAGGMRRLDKALGPDLGQCCGGRVAITIERFDARDRDAVAVLAAAERAGPLMTVGIADKVGISRRPAAPADLAQAPLGLYARLADGRIVERFGEQLTTLFLFGAGHVGRALSLALAPLSFAVTWADPRPGAFPQHVPANVTCLGERDPAALLKRAPDGAFVAVMTHSHALDLELVSAALTARRFAYVGLIGSATKRARFVSSMRKLGLPGELTDDLVCPIGLTAVKDKAPAAIAASVVAQLLAVRDALAQAPGAERSDTAASKRRGGGHG